MKKSNVFLESSYNYHAGETKPCGHWSVEEMTEFLKKIQNTDIPVESCLSSVFASIRENISIAHDYKTHYESFTISIYPTRQKCAIRDKKNCPKCIATGTCRDEFVINLIGKKLFADKYKEIAR